MNASSRPAHGFLAELESFFANPDQCREAFPLLSLLAIRLAARGHGADVLAIVERSPEAPLYAPLVGGLRLHLNLPCHEVGHSLDLARQIAARIRGEAEQRPSAA